MNRFTHRAAAWIACFAILLASLAPTVSIALSQFGVGASPGEHCSVMGAMLAKVQGADASGKPAPAKTNAPFKFCPLCQVHGAHASLLPAEPFEFSVPVRVLRLSVRFHSSSHAQSALGIAQPRGPPAFS